VGCRLHVAILQEIPQTLAIAMLCNDLDCFSGVVLGHGIAAVLGSAVSKVNRSIVGILI
jgi:hypothetical protein